MKLIVSALFVVASSMAFANEPAAPHAAAAPTAAAAKPGKKEAKAACKAEGKKGKELTACISAKMKM